MCNHFHWQERGCYLFLTILAVARYVSTLPFMPQRGISVTATLPAPVKGLFDAGVGEFLGDFGDILDKFLEGLVRIFVLGLLADLFPIGVNNKIQDIDSRSHVVFSDFYSDFIDFHWFLSKLNVACIIDEQQVDFFLTIIFNGASHVEESI